MTWLADPSGWVAFVTLVALELVLGVDNIIVIAILTGKLPAAKQPLARTLGLGLAMLMRLLLLGVLSWVIGLTQPWVVVAGHELSGRDFLLIGGGLFLLAKATLEIHDKLEGEGDRIIRGRAPSLAAVLTQIVLMDAVFSLDSVITAVGMVEQISIMIAAVIVAVGVMMVVAAPVSRFVHRHPTVKILALSFLLLIGVALMAEGFDRHIPKGYLYFAMAFSVFVESLNLRLRVSRVPPVKLHEPSLKSIS